MFFIGDFFSRFWLRFVTKSPHVSFSVTLRIEALTFKWKTKQNDNNGICSKGIASRFLCICYLPGLNLLTITILTITKLFNVLGSHQNFDQTNNSKLFTTSNECNQKIERILVRLSRMFNDQIECDLHLQAHGLRKERNTLRSTRSNDIHPWIDELFQWRYAFVNCHFALCRQPPSTTQSTMANSASIATLP